MFHAVWVNAVRLLDLCLKISKKNSFLPKELKNKMAKQSPKTAVTVKKAISNKSRQIKKKEKGVKQKAKTVVRQMNRNSTMKTAQGMTLNGMTLQELFKEAPYIPELPLIPKPLSKVARRGKSLKGGMKAVRRKRNTSVARKNVAGKLMECPVECM